jgi:large subunit ribosomal protein L21
MYAVIKSGARQYRVEEGQQLDVDLLGDAEQVEFTPVLVVDGETVLATPGDLAGAKVTARVLGEHKGKKIIGFTYKPKSNQRKRWGHRQRYHTIEVTGISRG